MGIVMIARGYAPSAENAITDLKMSKDILIVLALILVGVTLTGWLGERVFERVDLLQDRVEAKVTLISERLDDRMNRLGDRLDAAGNRISERMQRVDKRFNDRLSRLERLCERYK